MEERQAGTVQQAERRYRLRDIMLLGKPVSANRYKLKYMQRTRAGRLTPRSEYTAEALAWLTQAKIAASQAAMWRGEGIPHPREWPRPLRISVYVRDGRIDLDNALKVAIDGVKLGLEVDDKRYEYGCIVREEGERGMRIVVESAPLPMADDTRPALETTKPALPTRANCRHPRRETSTTATSVARRARTNTLRVATGTTEKGAVVCS